MISSSIKIAFIGITFLAALAFYRQVSLPTETSNQPLVNQVPSKQKDTTEYSATQNLSISSAHIKTTDERKESERLGATTGIEPNIELSLHSKASDEPSPLDAEAPVEPPALPPEPEQYDSEEIDAYWAFEKENYYINLFSEAESLSGFVLSEAQCKTRQCKLSFLLADEEQKDEITNRLMEKLMAESQDLRVSFDLNSSSDEAVLYIEDVKEF